MLGVVLICNLRQPKDTLLRLTETCKDSMRLVKTRNYSQKLAGRRNKSSFESWIHYEEATLSHSLLGSCFEGMKENFELNPFWLYIFLEEKTFFFFLKRQNLKATKQLAGLLHQPNGFRNVRFWLSLSTSFYNQIKISSILEKRNVCAPIKNLSSY